MSAFTFDVRVYFEDTDFSGRVYHGAYVRFMERGRTEMLRASGLDHRALASAEPAVFFTLRRMDVTFHAGAVIDDLLTVETVPTAAGRASFTLSQTITKGETRIVSASVDLLLIDANGRPRRPSAMILEALTPHAPPA